ncbi:hypothetical protein Tco_1068361 [Tanacetum coccineum]|uniref:Uncharacterized protein n=1 Tax=Tanacetum coccineum TaxID=301880 RepID=A0ABQ5HGC5_9ASTR
MRQQSTLMVEFVATLTGGFEEGNHVRSSCFKKSCTSWCGSKLVLYLRGMYIGGQLPEAVVVYDSDLVIVDRITTYRWCIHDMERHGSGESHLIGPEASASPTFANADNQALADWNALFDRHNEVACLMLGAMSPKLYQQFGNKSPQKMITELQKMYGKPPGVELQELMNMFHSCKQAEGQSVSDHVLLMKSYLDQLATLNYAFPDKVSISFILNSLSSEFQAFVQNYNMQSLKKTISEVHSLLIEFEKSINRNKQQIVGASSTPHVMVIQSGRPQPYKKERPAKDGQCHCVLLQDITAFCFKTSCVLSKDITAFCFKTSLRFASRHLAFCLKTSLHFASRHHCVLLQDILRFVKTSLRFV